jgi:hypothetical protein
MQNPIAAVTAKCLTNQFRIGLEKALKEDFLALGLLGWYIDEGALHARGLLFSPHFSQGCLARRLRPP